MRLKMHLATANEELVLLINEGYAAIGEMMSLYNERKSQAIYDDSKDVNIVAAPVSAWGDRVSNALERIFPTQLEQNLFENPESQFGMVSGDYKFSCALARTHEFIRALNKIRTQSLPEYTDLPLEARLYVEDIDSFRKVRDVNPSTVLPLLQNGYLNQSEDFVQMGLEQILDVPFHKKDWGGETNDLYTANVMVQGARTPTAFLLKGNGLKASTMEIKNCGKNGDQIVRLCKSPAQLFIVQYVGNISEAIADDIDGKVRNLRAEGKQAWYCLMDGQDTARVLRAYGKL